MASTVTQTRDQRLDLVRGAAVVCMVQFHTVDSFASPATRASFLGQASVFFGGGAAPLFLALAGLGAGLGFRKRANAGALIARGLEIWTIAILFRIQEWMLGGEGASSLSLMRVDVLNCIGISLIVVAALLKLSPKGLPVAAALFMGLAPVMASWATGLPPALAYYLGGPGHLSLFPMFPWVGIACVGASFAYLPDKAAAYALGTYGLILAARLLFPEPLRFAALNDNVVFTLERTSLAIGLLSVAHLFPAKRLLLQLGQHSLLIYWVHVELVYGLWFHGKKGTLSIPATTLAVVAIMASMWTLSVVRRRLSWQ